MPENISDLMWPLLVWAVGWVISTADNKIRGWMERKNYDKALKLYDLIAKVVNQVYGEEVREKKNSGSFTDAAKTAAMESAIGKIGDMAEKSNIVLPSRENLKLMVEQVISDRKRGNIDPLWKGLDSSEK